jgi:N-acetylmuramoyl-L-alanine amidase
MKFPVDLKLVTVMLVGLTAISAAKSAIASTLFSQQEVDSSRFAVVASPYAGGTAYQLLIIEQLSSARPCWSESGAGLVQVNPLLSEFDFTGICGRSIDSNGYSIRTAGEDLGWRYSLRVVRRDNDMLLVGAPTVDRQAGDLVIARTGGLNNGFTKFKLEPGWRLTKRAFNGQPVGHVYLTNDQTLASLNTLALANRPTPPVVSTASLPRPVVPVVQLVPAKPQPAPVTSTKPSWPMKWIFRPTSQPAAVPSLQTRQPAPTAAPTPTRSMPISVPPPENSANRPLLMQPGATKLPNFKPGLNDVVVPVVVVPY